MNKFFRIIALLMLIPMGMRAQDVRIEVRTRNTVAAGQTFQITFDVNAKARDFKMPTLKNLTLVGGPSTSSSTSMSIINGNVSKSVSNAFTILVRAESEGVAHVGAASVVAEGKTVSSKPFSITVEKADPHRQQQQQQQSQGGWPWGQPSRPHRQQQQQQQQQQPQPTTTIDNNTLFARASINKSTLYQGEEAIIVYKIYTQVPLTQFQIDKLPRNKGFWSEDLSENMTQVKQYTETYNGRQYQVAEIRRGALFPQEAGKLTIAPLKTDVVAIIETQMQRTGTIFDFFIDDPFFAPTRQQAVVRSLTSNSINVNVKPLPEAPVGFAGGVGHFDITAKSDLNELHANEAFTYSVTISGRGNLSLLEAPQIVFPKGMEVYEPRVIDNINKGDNGLSGSRTFEWIVTPQTQGEYELPAIEYVYFDPGTGQYVTRHSNAIKIKVGKPLHTTASKSDVKELNSDIHHIRKSTSLSRVEESGKAGMLFWLLIALPIVASGVVIVLARRQQGIEGDEASMKLQRATKLARKRLRNAEKHLHDGDDALFYEEIYKALWGGIADKFNIQQSLLSSDTIRQHLAEKNVEPALQERILQTLADVDFARFAPGDSSAKKQSIYDEAMNTITEIAAIKVKLKG
ncbi:MAG: protein BatD [Bacteroidales bacterium]|nr:protein BatD [Bacteroidales bacterium]